MPGINAIIVVAETITFSIPPALGFAPVILNTAIDITKAIIAAIIIIKKGLYHAYVSRVVGNVVNSFFSFFSNSFDKFIKSSIDLKFYYW